MKRCILSCVVLTLVDLIVCDNERNFARRDPLSELSGQTSDYVNPLSYFLKFKTSSGAGENSIKERKYSPVPVSLSRFIRLGGATNSIRRRSLDICYFLGDDILNSHLLYNPNWGDGSPQGVRNFINELTFQTNKMLGLENIRLTWKGPFDRHDKHRRYPEDPETDVLSLGGRCDVIIFLVFNDFSEGIDSSTNGHKYSGFSEGGVCESTSGLGYAVIVDQGFLGEVWMGPQVLAHHLLQLLSSDLNDGSLGKKENKYCPSPESLLYKEIIAGAQKVDQCVVDKLNRSKVSLRECMQD